MRLLVLGVLSLHKYRREPRSDSASGKLYRGRSTEVAVFSLHLAAPPFLKEIANIDILKFTIQITFAMR